MAVAVNSICAGAKYWWIGRDKIRPAWASVSGNPRPISQVLGRGLQVQRHRIVNQGLNTMAGQRRLQRLPAIRLDDECMERVVGFRALVRHKNKRRIEQVTIAPSIGPARGNHVVQSPKPVQQDRGLECVHARNEAPPGDGVAALEAVVAQTHQRLGDVWVIGGHEPAIPCPAQVLQRVSGKAPQRSQGSGRLAVIGRAHRLGGVFDHKQSVPRGDIVDGVHLGDAPGQVHRQNGCCAGCKCGLDAFGIHVLVRPHIHEHRVCARVNDGRGAGDK